MSGYGICVGCRLKLCILALDYNGMAAVNDTIGFGDSPRDCRRAIAHESCAEEEW